MQQTDNHPVRVAIAGLGRSGWNIHAETIGKMTDRYKLTAVSDPNSERRAEAKSQFGCKAYENFEDLLATDDTELLVVATPNLLHTEHTIAALHAGCDVICEKPMALSVKDADRMIEAAKNSGRMLAPFQNRRYEPSGLKIKQILDSGQLGRIIQIRMAWHSFGRRWDWQTLREFGGGALNNNGTHLIDQALFLLGEGEVKVFVEMKNALSSGDAEDHIKVIMQLATGEGPTLDLELTSASAYPQDNWHIMATGGGLSGTTSKLQWKWVDWLEMPPRPVNREPTVDRRYNSETLSWQEDQWELAPDAPWPHVVFYRELFATIRTGKPLFVTPESVRRQIQVLDACRAACTE